MTVDAVARLLLDHVGAPEGRVLVLDDSGGGLTTELMTRGADVAAACDDVRDDAALPASARTTDPDPHDISLAMLRLPKSLGALEDYCQLLTQGPPTLRVLAGGRVKHMTLSQNALLQRYFGRVRATRGRDKARVLIAEEPLGSAPRWPKSRRIDELGLTVTAYGSTFNTFRLDAGTALLVRALHAAGLLEARPRTGRAWDLGCGSGILATLLAQAGWSVTASDTSSAALASTQLTARNNGVDVFLTWRDGLRGVEDHSVQLLVTNPPFHRGTAKDSASTLEMIDAAGAVLAPEGELWMVFNSHLPYLPALRRSVGPTTLVQRDRHYIVTRSRARGFRTPGLNPQT